MGKVGGHNEPAQEAAGRNAFLIRQGFLTRIIGPPEKVALRIKKGRNAFLIRQGFLTSARPV